MTSLTPVREAADHFGLAISTLHYWERRGLITATRRSGQRYYDDDQLYRIALIKHWRRIGGLGLSKITELLAEQHRWREVVAGQLAEIERERARLDTAHDYLVELLTCRREGSLEDCQWFRDRVDLPAHAAAS
ncbi:MerR family transcriptional regulator [Amycolatopsis alba]|uniref:MerR family transcriptional regulator n=1 Tax=Amycolatopsis alba DSM 44262 TaxID=1125972 RepID=A0A229RXS6_AMYAL|nr:MerR family transcriptional regulator [Amycolatopsis alba]OXM51497.1 MerR family transcriptional regulator [Amycolatopsis alba DSM 44262]